MGATAFVSNFKRLRRPYKLNFAVTYRCQSRCINCNIWKARPSDELTLDEITKFAKKNGFFEWIGLTGGEPFLREDFPDIVRAFRDGSRHLYLVTAPTNSLCGASHIESAVKEVLELGIPKFVITVSLDGYKGLHDRIRGVPNNYEKAIGIFKMLKELHKSCRNLGFVFGYTLSMSNKGEFEKTFQAVKGEIPDITYNDFHINLAQTSENYYKNSSTQISACGEDAAQELQGILSRRRFSLNPVSALDTMFLKKLVYFAKTGKSPMRSRSLEASLFMDSSGNVYPSIMSNISVGNVRAAGFDLMRIWDGERAKQVRESIANGEEPQHWTSCEAYQALLGNVLGSI